MAGVAGDHRPAQRLAHVADVEAGPAEAGGLPRQVHQELDELRVAPVAVARQPHRLPGRAGFGQLDVARGAAARIAAKGRRRPAIRGAERAEDVLGQRIGRRRNRQHGHRRGGEDGFQVADHCPGSPSGLTHLSSASDRRNITISGDMPMRWLPVAAVTV